MNAEEYIKAYTRGCSNELVHGGYHEWLTPENALAAVELAREEMMKDAVEGEVCGRVIDHINVRVEGYNALTPSNITHIPCERKNFHKFKIGDKVKVIIIKE